MEYIARFFTIALIPIIVGGVLAFLRRPKKLLDGEVFLPTSVFVLGVIAAALFTIVAAFLAFVSGEVAVSIVFLLFSLLGIILMVACINCRIKYNEDGFVSKSFFGVETHYTYDELTSIREGVNDTILYVGEKRVTVETMAVGSREFIAFAKKKYRTLKDGRPLPKSKKDKKDIFCGNVKDPEGFIVAFVLIGVLVVIACVVVPWFIFFNPSDIDNTERQEVVFESMETKESGFELVSADGGKYRILYVGEGFEEEMIRSLCDGETKTVVYTNFIEPDDEDEYFEVRAVEHKEKRILDFEQTNRWYTDNNWYFIFVPIVLLLLYAGLVVGTIVVGRNPKKYKKYVHLFFKDGYVDV